MINKRIDFGFGLCALLMLLGVPTMAWALQVKESTDTEVPEEVERVGEVEGVDQEIDFGMLEHPLAIIPFKTRGKGVEGMGEKVTDLMFANLAINPALQLVDREDLDAVLTEAELNLSGLVNPAEAIQIGKLSGAKVLITGSIFQVDQKLYVVCKIIGTETTRVVGASAKGDIEGGLDETVTSLSGDVVKTLSKNIDRLVAKQAVRKDRIAAIKKTVKGKKLPKVYVSIKEQHVGRSVIDPAAETELMSILKACGFDVIDSKGGDKSKADVIITGEGLSEYATRTKKLISVKARLEIKAVDRVSGKVIHADRQTKMAVDLGEQLAGKKALQQAAEELAGRLVPLIATEDK